MGHSGCLVSLCAAEGRYFVRKQSGSRNYNDRLSAQAAKQKRLASIIDVPEIISVGSIEEFSFIDMEYVHAMDFGTYLSSSSMAALADFSASILALISRFASVESGCIDSRRFEAKVGSVAAAVRRNPLYPWHARVLEAAVTELSTHSWAGIPRTECHGDFTLENMLIREDGSIVLIDLLDGELETAWLDVAKILYDLESGWSLRRRLWRGDLLAQDRLSLALCGFLHEEILAHVTAFCPGLRAHLRPLQILSALRVLPYTSNKDEFARITSAIGCYVQSGASP